MTSEGLGTEARYDPDIEALLGAPRTSAEGEAERLRTLLARVGRPWSGSPYPRGSWPWSEVVCILAGIDPRGGGDAETGDFPFLPGSLALYGFGKYPTDPRGRRRLALAVSDRVGLLVGVHLPTGRPRAAIKAAIKADLPPPWLPWARSDPTCAQLLPPDLAAPRKARLTRSEAARKGGEAKRDKSPDHILLYGVGKQTFDEIKNSGFPDVRTSKERLIKQKIADKITEKLSKHIRSQEGRKLPELLGNRSVLRAVSKWLCEK